MSIFEYTTFAIAIILYIYLILPYVREMEHTPKMFCLNNIKNHTTRRIHQNTRARHVTNGNECFCKCNAFS